jgi:hypothetical protein
MTPGDYRKNEYFNDNDVQGREEDRTAYGGSSPATWRLGSTIRSRRPTKSDADMERAEDDISTPMTPAGRKESAVSSLTHIVFSSSLCIIFG